MPVYYWRSDREDERFTQSLSPDLVALTGDMVDGPVERLAPHVALLRALAQDARAWIAQFQSMGVRVLLNAQVMVSKGAARMLVGGVLDPAVARSSPGAGPRPDVAAGNGDAAAFRLLLAHNPKIAHAAGLSREGRMWVYVSAGTGTWGPPVRLGTSPELTLLRLLRA